jgi:hypothetical protein
MTVDPPAVVITTKDIYDKLVDVEKSVTLMTPQAQVITDHEARMRMVEAALPEKLEDRLRSLEKWKWSVPPTAATALIAIVQQLLAHKG